MQINLIKKITFGVQGNAQNYQTLPKKTDFFWTWSIVIDRQRPPKMCI